MVYKKISLIILSTFLLLLFGCTKKEVIMISENEIQTNVDPDSYIEFDNNLTLKKEIRFWGEDYILYETTSLIDEIPHTNLYLQNIDTGVTNTIEKDAEEFMVIETIQLDKSNIVYIKRPSEYIGENKILNQIVCLNLETLEENIIKEEVTNHPVNDLKRLDNNKFISFTPKITESGYEYIFTIFDLTSKNEININSFSYNTKDVNGTIASAFATDSQYIYIYVNIYEDSDTLPEQSIYVFDHNGVYQKKYSVDINAFLDLQKYFDGTVENDTVVDMMKYSNYFLLKTQHSRYVVFKEIDKKLLSVEVPIDLLEPFKYRVVTSYSNDADNIYFYNLTNEMLEFNTKKGVFYETVLQVPQNKIDYEIMSVYVDTKEKLLFQTSDWRKNDPNRSYGYFVLDCLLEGYQ